jgi:hypothetical protein
MSISGGTSGQTPDAFDGPKASDFMSTNEFTKAREAYHDNRIPSVGQTLGRSARLASNSIFAIRLQLTRLHTSRIVATSDDVDDTIMQRWADSEFLIIALWRLRTIARITASIGSVRDNMTAAIEKFDQQLPDLQMMRHVSQHLDDYAIDHPTRRRQRKPGSQALIGRRLLEVAGFENDEFHWLRGRLNFADAETAANALYSEILKARDAYGESQ